MRNNAKDDNSKLITVSEYAELRKKNISSVRANVLRGRIPAKKINGKWYIEKDTKYPDRVRYKDITGHRFGKLVAVKFVGITEEGAALWECACDCGGRKIVRAGNLKYGYTKSCGCIPCSEGIDIKGKKYGRITAIRPTEKRDQRGSVIWECSCSCGNPNPIYASARRLIEGQITSCGCKKVEAGKKMQPNAVEGAKKSPKSGRFETNINAKEWELVSPDGIEYKCTNLLLWARKHTELFGFEPGDHSASKIAHGISNIAGTYYGTRTGVYTYKGWSLKSIPQKPEKYIKEKTL